MPQRATNGAPPAIPLRRERRYDFRRRLRPFFRGGTFAPERRAFESPIAIACFRLFTLRRERPERSVPRFRSRIV
jgi:hypothetical protein